jgi:hypothetical protein
VPDAITVKDASKAYTNCPEGVHVAVCVDVIDLGMRVETFQGQHPRLTPKLAIVYQVDELNPDTGKRFELNVEKTASMNERAGLRKWLEAWRGKPYTEEQAKAGIKLDKMVGACGLLTVAHKQSRQGRTYANAANITPLPKGTTGIEADRYERAPFWEERKAQYLREAQDFLATQAQQPPAPRADDGDEDDLPF